MKKIMKRTRSFDLSFWSCGRPTNFSEHVC